MIKKNSKIAAIMFLATMALADASSYDTRVKSVVNNYMTQLDSIMGDERKKMQFEEWLFEQGDEELGSLLEAKKEYEVWQQELLDGFGENVQKKAIFRDILNDKNSLFARLTPQAVQFFANMAQQAYKLDDALQHIEDEGLMEKAQKTQSEISANNDATKQLDLQIEKINRSVGTRIGVADINREEIARIFRDRGEGDDAIVAIMDASGIALVSMLEREKGKIEQVNKELNKLLKLEKVAQKLQLFLDTGTYMGVENKPGETSHAKKLEAKGVFYRHNGEASGFAAYSPEENTLYISIAGTKSWADFFSDVQAWKAVVALSEGGDLLENMKFHSGFAQIFGRFYTQTSENAKRIIQPLCEASKGKGPLNIITTGHSLGGALAIVYAAAIKKWASSRGCDVDVSSITFGSPAIISSSSQKALVDRFNHGSSSGQGNIVNIRHKYDPVPRLAIHLALPGVVVPFGLGMFVDRMGDFNLVPTLNPHGMGNYGQGADIEFAKTLKEIERYVRTTEGVDPVADLQKAIDRYSAKPGSQSETEALSLNDMKREIEALDATTLKKRKMLDDFVAANRAVFNSQQGLDIMNKQKDEVELAIVGLQEMRGEFERLIKGNEMFLPEEHSMFTDEQVRLDREVQLEKEKLAMMREVYSTTIDVIKKQVGSWQESLRKLIYGK